MTSLIDAYRARGLLSDATEGAAEHLNEAHRVVYCGFDPTGPSLHLGHLIPIMGLVHAQRAGHTPIALVGGGTGLIGDPSGRNSERRLLTKELVAEHAESIRGQLAHFLDFDAPTNPARMRNNLEWLGAISYIDVLRDVGKHFSVNQMLAKESVKRRIEGEGGISYTEFSYALLQSYDFVELHRREGCTVQIGGSDQWGNITSGVDLVRRMEGARAFGAVLPLITNASGSKFGKSDGASVWLDPAKTSPYRFYQYWINVDDADVVRYVRLFTLLEESEIADLAAATEEEPQARSAQRALARDVTRRLHGEDGLASAERATAAFFRGDFTGLTGEEVADVFADAPSSEVAAVELGGEGWSLVEALVVTELCTSNGDARRSIEGGGIYVNGVRVQDVAFRITMEATVEGRYLLLRKGKKRFHLVAISQLT